MQKACSREDDEEQRTIDFPSHGCTSIRSKKVVVIVSTVLASLELLAFVYLTVSIWFLSDESSLPSFPDNFYSFQLISLGISVIFLVADWVRIYMLWRWRADTPPHNNDPSTAYQATKKCMCGSVIWILILYPISFAILNFTVNLPNFQSPFLPSLLVVCGLLVVDLYIFLPCFVFPWTCGLSCYWKRACTHHEHHKHQEESEDVI